MILSSILLPCFNKDTWSNVNTHIQWLNIKQKQNIKQKYKAKNRNTMTCYIRNDYLDNYHTPVTVSNFYRVYRSPKLMISLIGGPDLQEIVHSHTNYWVRKFEKNPMRKLIGQICESGMVCRICCMNISKKEIIWKHVRRTWL